MAKFREDIPGLYEFLCPGCKETHYVNTDPKNRATFNACWQFNGDINKPTISPSLLVRWADYKDGPDGLPDQKTVKDVVCHSFIRNGKIQFLNDCTHALKGQTVDMPEWD